MVFVVKIFEHFLNSMRQFLFNHLIYKKKSIKLAQCLHLLSNLKDLRFKLSLFLFKIVITSLLYKHNKMLQSKHNVIQYFINV